jgi:hypothetical protein
VWAGNDGWGCYYVDGIIECHIPAGKWWKICQAGPLNLEIPLFVDVTVLNKHFSVILPGGSDAAANHH